MAAIPEQLCAALRPRLSAEAVVRPREPLARHTTLRVGGEADCYVEPAGEEDLAAVLRFCHQEAVPFFLLGRGSNLLVRDRGVRGVVVCLGHTLFSGVEVEGERLRCGAGARLKVVAAEARRALLGGLEFLGGIPGSVGGALRMNAGAMGSWTFDRVESVRVMDRTGAVAERARGALEVRYRGCRLFEDHIALAAVFRGQTSSLEAIEQRSQEFSRHRWATQPATPSAGCVFKNPASIAAGRLIDELGLKSRRVGGARVSDVHANFIVNEGTATARDVLELIDLIRETARRERGIEFETEVEILGEPEEREAVTATGRGESACDT